MGCRAPPACALLRWLLLGCQLHSVATLCTLRFSLSPWPLLASVALDGVCPLLVLGHVRHTPGQSPPPLRPAQRMEDRLGWYRLNKL